MTLTPNTTNRITFDPHKVWYECECGWKTRKRTPGKKRPRMILMERPFHCPKCNRQLSDMTSVW